MTDFPGKQLGDFPPVILGICCTATVSYYKSISIDQSIYRQEHPATITVRIILINSMDEM
jgi:hypothetical protein